MIHETAIIDSSATIHDDVEIGAYTIIGPDVEIAAGCVIGPHVVINGPTKIGANNKIYQFASIGEDPQDLKYKGERTTLTIGSGNTFREYVTVHRGTVTGISETIIGNNGLYMAYVHIAHDCVVGDNVVFSNCASLAGHAEVGDYAILAGFSMVHQFTRVGKHAFAGMASGMNRDLPPYVLGAGNPGRPVCINKEGLKRRGFDEELIKALHKAFKLLFKSADREAANNELESLSKHFPEVAHMVKFVKESDRGVVR